MQREAAAKRLGAITLELNRLYIAAAENQSTATRLKMEGKLMALANGETVAAAHEIATQTAIKFISDADKFKAQIQAFSEERDFLMFCIQHDLIQSIDWGT